MFRRRPLVVGGAVDAYGERRYTALGESERGRRLMAVFTASRPGEAKVITARDMAKRERRLYERKKRR